jgi:Na+-transporting NADH:ubiquinone oxidoreductase subunit F
MDPIFVISILLGILVLVSLILIGAERLFGGSGEKMLTVNNSLVIPITEADTALNILSKNEIYIPSACGGKATCGLCKIKITEGAFELKPTETPFIGPKDAAEGIRLSCQTRVAQDMKIEIPESLFGAKEYKVELAALESLTYDIKLVRFKMIEPKTLDFYPGQYAQFIIPGVEAVRAYSFAGDAKIKDHVEFLVRMVQKGVATTYVHEVMKPGDQMIITGPYGDFYLREESSRDIICIAGGSGKAPIRSILYRLRDLGMPRKVRYFFGAVTKKDLYYTEEFVELSKEFPNFEYIPALSGPSPEDQWDGETGLITEVLDRMTGDLTGSEAYLCGSPGMIFACIKVLDKHKLPRDHTYYDSFA